MRLTDKLAVEAVGRGLLEPGVEIDLTNAFYLVRDMPYRRARDRHPETLITEWCGTCSGKHYLLKALFAELGYNSQVMACTSADQVSEDNVPAEMHDKWVTAGGRFVDVHNYIVLDLPGGEMVVDATWPDGNQKYGLPVNADFIIGQDQQIACTPMQTWVVPAGDHPQRFKDQLLREHFTPAELDFRDAFIQALSDWLA